MTRPKQGALDLEACEQEPIHFIGALQDPYALVAWHPETGVVMAATQNLEPLTGRPLEDIGAGTIDDFIAPETLATIPSGSSSPVPLILPGGRSVLARRCRIGAWAALVLDPDTAASMAATGFDSITAFHTLIEDALGNPEPDIGALAHGLAGAFHRLTGFDRVMVYEFDTDWNGTVIAEEAAPQLDTRFLGLTFPSSDIPRMARDLFQQNRVRPLIDVDGTDIPLISFGHEAPDSIDIGALPERAVSPIHLAYLRNMGVSATLTIALIVDGHLWGLLTCHHYDGPRKLSAGDIALCRVLCDLTAHALSRMHNKSRIAAVAHMDTLGRALRKEAQGEDPQPAFAALLDRHADALLEAAAADGLAVRIDGKAVTIGAAPDQGLSALFSAMQQKAESLRVQDFATNHLAAHFPELSSKVLPAAAGAAYVYNPAHMTALLVWRAGREMHTTWAGDPEKRVSAVGRLSPRGSFELWQEQSYDKCPPWQSDQLQTMAGLLTILSDIGWTLKRRVSEEEARAARVAAEAARDDLEYAALHDPLTDLPNRRFLDLLLADLSANPPTDSGATVAVLHVDLDDFKAVNDLKGHSAGDAVLVQVGQLLRSCTRGSEVVIRVGGDEFIILVPNVTGNDQIETLAQRIVDTFAHPVLADDTLFQLGASIGIATAPRNDFNVTQLLTHADMALYDAKRQGRGRYRFITGEQAERRMVQRRLGAEIVQGFQNNAFTLHYQLQFDALDHQICGAEALLRWNHPERGLLSPDAFLDAAESVGVLEKLDAASLSAALQTRQNWAARGLEVPRISLNVSAQRLRNMDVGALLAQHPTALRHIAFELLETMDFDGLDSASLANLDAIRKAGIALEVDDFGTGHTSILSLVRMQPDGIKIDRNLVMPAPDSPTACDLIRAVVNIARTLDIAVTAEGVETAAHASLMRDLGCNVLQGYGLARPMSEHDVLAFAASRT